jgi:signal transduction histidine kinase/CheY-like chemotaxis protein
LEQRIIVAGESRWLDMRAEVESDSEGRPLAAIGTVADITERRALEQQLREAQRMQAVGQLTGGIAHDFNNNINVIAGFGKLVLKDLAPDDPRRADLQQVLDAAGRAARLTQQLLAFSRRQVLEPRILDLVDVVVAIEPMLMQTLGENIELTVRHGAQRGSVQADPGQIEQVIVNLAVNARDAMPDGGRLTIEVADMELNGSSGEEHPDVTPGSYVMLSVTDTGTGMDEATRLRIFDPFFTTKPAGEGTGLGLATTYGTVRQSNGFIWVESEPGEGSTFKVFLPRIVADPQKSLPVSDHGFADGGSETILIVEDDEAGRTYARRVLEGHGYRVREAGSGQEAIDVWAELDGEVDLLVSDVVLPGMSGPDLAERLKELKADISVLFVSGYTADAIIRHGVIAPDVTLLSKPLDPDTFARKVRELLDEARVGRVPAMSSAEAR